MMQITRFVPSHAYSIIKNIDDNTIRFAEAFMNGKAYTAFLNDKVFACGGIVINWKGCGEVWLLPSPEALKHPIALFKIVKKWVKKFIEEEDMVRLQAPIEASKTVNRKFIEHLGFHAEGVLECYGLQGQDHIMYALINRR
jgi:hypothetical protein